MTLQNIKKRISGGPLSFGGKRSKVVRVMQWNVLADGLGDDGFLTTEFSPIFESSRPGAKGYDATEFMKMVREAKLADKASGASDAFAELKAKEKKLKRAQSAGSDDDSTDDLETEISKLKETANKSRLFQLKKQFQDSPQLAEVDREVLAWNMRYNRIKAVILRADPDVITVQELDHLKQFMEDPILSVKYTCFVDPAKTYSIPSYYQGKDEKEDDLSPNHYFQHILASGAAFAPKSYSNANMFRRKRSKHEVDVDDDGVAVFWKKEVFLPVELGFLKLPPEGERSQSVVEVTLEYIKTQQRVNILSSHLPSGDEKKKEIERLRVLKNPSAEWVAKRICLVNGSWKEVPYESDKIFDGIASYARYFTERIEVDSSTTIFTLDANSRPTFPLTKMDQTSPETNVWQTILGETGLESIWVQTSFLEKSGDVNDPSHPFVISVNKMRGPSSNQPAKIGEHQLELIDHVFTNGKKAKLVREVELSAKESVPMAPLKYKSKEEEAELNLYPSSKMPSDHLPILVDITL